MRIISARLFVTILLISVLYGCPRATPVAAPGTVTDTKNVIKFEDVSATSGIKFNRQNGAFGKKWFPETMGGGAAFIDYDNDGYQDILIVNGDWWEKHELTPPRPTLTLYHNEHNGTFTDVTVKMGLNVSIQGMGVAVGDFDNDGFDDIYISAVGQGKLFKNLAGKGFKDVTVFSGIKDMGWGTSAAWVDYDNDGLLDLFVCHYVKWTPQTDRFCGTTNKTYCLPEVYEGESCCLYHNEGNGKFTDVTRKSGIFNNNSKGLGVAILDINGDGWPDIVVACDMVPNLVYVNQKNGTFKGAGVSSGLALGENGSPHAGMGIDVGDYRNSGKPGLAIGNFTNDGLFVYDVDTMTGRAERNHSSTLTTATIAYITFGVVFGDLDNDGALDIFAVNGHLDDTITEANGGTGYRQPAVVMHGQQGGNFIDVSSTAGPAIGLKDVGRGLARGDFDNDGKLDLVLVPNIGPARLLKNTSRTDGSWLTVSLQGTTSNRDGYGAVVTVTINGKKYIRYASSGSSYCSAHDKRLHFGLGAVTGQAEIEVKWPAGKTEKYTTVSLPGAYTCVEGMGKK